MGWGVKFGCQQIGWSSKNGACCGCRIMPDTSGSGNELEGLDPVQSIQKVDTQYLGSNRTVAGSLFSSALRRMFAKH